jgi:hypothetical protein
MEEVVGQEGQQQVTFDGIGVMAGYPDPLAAEKFRLAIGADIWVKVLRLGRRVQNMIRAALTTAGETTRFESAISKGLQQRRREAEDLFAVADEAAENG